MSVDRWSGRLIGVSRLLCQIGFFISTFSVAAADVVVVVSSICVVSENSSCNNKVSHATFVFEASEDEFPWNRRLEFADFLFT